MKTNKKKLTILFSALMALSLAACGGESSSTPDNPSDADLKSDVQTYITEVVDDSAEITHFQVEDSGAGSEEDTFEATCIVTYANDTIQYVEEFDLNYTLKDDAWELDKCKINSDYADRSSQAVGEDTKASADGSTEAGGDAEAEETSSTEASSSETVTQSDDLEDYTFTLDGVVYQLPFAWTELTDNGWRIYSSGTYEDDKIGGTQYTSIQVEKDNVTVYVDVINMSGNTKQLKDCKVAGIQVEASDIEDIDFSIAKGITVGATEDEVREAFGDPDNSNDSDHYITLTYATSSNNTHIKTLIYCDKGTDEYDYACITLQNFVATEDEEETQTSDEVPAYLSTYKAPSELGDDKLSGNIEIEGDVYTLPAPVSAFTDNGWKIASNTDVASGRENYIKLTRDGKELEVGVTNLAEYQTKASNCAVYNVHVYHYEGDSKEVTIELPGGLTVGTSSEELKKWAGDKFDYSKSDDRESYSYYENKRDFSINITCEETVQNITLKNSTWSYE